MISLIDLTRNLAAIAGGGVIGLAFGLLQNAARRKNEDRQGAGQLKSGWSLMPGSGVRVAYLLVALALIQLVCPLLFVDGTQWFVSGGLLAGYGWTLVSSLRNRIRTAAR